MRDEKQHRRVIGLTLALTIVAGMALIGCQTQHEAPSTSAPPAGTEAAEGSTQPITLTWDQQSSCVNFSQGTITIKVGDKIRFNSSVGQTVTLRVSASAFGANDTTMVISANGSYTTARAATPGSYNVNSAPAMCSPGGGVGPTIVVEETK